MSGHGSKGSDVTNWRKNPDTSLAPMEVDAGIREGGDGVPQERSEEDNGHCRVVEAVVFLAL